MRSLQTVRGKWHLYLKVLNKDANEGCLYSLQTALIAGTALAQVTKEVVYVMEVLEDGKKKLYEIPAGGGLPQLKEEAVAAHAVNGPMKLEVD